VTLTGFQLLRQDYVRSAPASSRRGGTVSASLYNAVARGINLKISADQASMKPG